MIKANKYKRYWLPWLLISGAMGAAGAYALVSDYSWVYAPGKMSDGHYQIEMKCDACHGESFSGSEAIQDSCVRCHGAELKSVDDSHPKSKFTDPRNADVVEKLDARFCVTCHMEHKPSVTDKMGVTVPVDVCELCHEDIGKDRESHVGLGFDGCLSSGCHNYHDNTALYEDFLVKHGDEINGETLFNNGKPPFIAKTNYGQWLAKVKGKTTAPLLEEDAVFVGKLNNPKKIVKSWAASVHAQGGVNCGGCHYKTEGEMLSWTLTSVNDTCKRCHETERSGFVKGKHGMRIGEGLTAMLVGSSRMNMIANSRDKELSCSSCHDPHSTDTKKASVEACLGCHADEHSTNYKKSKHFELFRDERAAQGKRPLTGVSCATCHMPRHEKTIRGHKRILVEHNQSLNLRPREKQIRSVCLNCHSLRFSIDALADDRLVDANFVGSPNKHIESIDMSQEAKRVSIAKKNQKRLNKEKLMDK